MKVKKSSNVNLFTNNYDKCNLNKGIGNNNNNKILAEEMMSYMSNPNDGLSYTRSKQQKYDNNNNNNGKNDDDVNVKNKGSTMVTTKDVVGIDNNMGKRIKNGHVSYQNVVGNETKTNFDEILRFENLLESERIIKINSHSNLKRSASDW